MVLFGHGSLLTGDNDGDDGDKDDKDDKDKPIKDGGSTAGLPPCNIPKNQQSN